MKLVHHGLPGHKRPGAVDAEGHTRDLAGEVPDIAGDTLLPEPLSRLAALDPRDVPEIRNERPGPCVAGVGKYVCIGLDYRDHALEAGREPRDEPVMFLKATSAICGSGDPLELPKGGRRTDCEIELAVVIGAPGIHIAKDEALAHVAGYCVTNDLTGTLAGVGMARKLGRFLSADGTITVGISGLGLQTRPVVARWPEPVR